jgi:hypothetical protein
MGVDRAHVSSMERGLQNVTLLTLWEASQAIGVSPASLLGDEPQLRTGLNQRSNTKF